MKIKSYEELEIWKYSINVSKNIYLLTKRKPLKSDFGLKDQLQRSAVSIASNIAEGFEYNSTKMFIRYLKIAKGSAGELRTQVIIAYKIGYLSETDFQDLTSELTKLSSKIQSLINHLRKFIKKIIKH